MVEAWWRLVIISAQRAGTEAPKVELVRMGAHDFTANSALDKSVTRIDRDSRHVINPPWPYLVQSD